MVVSYSLRFPLSPFPNPNSNPISNFPLLPPRLFRCYCSSTEIETPTQFPPNPEPLLSPSKWHPFLKKKVVMRVGYVGSDYRGLQMQRDEHRLSNGVLLKHCEFDMKLLRKNWKLLFSRLGASVTAIMGICTKLLGAEVAELTKE